MVFVDISWKLCCEKPSGNHGNHPHWWSGGRIGRENNWRHESRPKGTENISVSVGLCSSLTATQYSLKGWVGLISLGSFCVRKQVCGEAKVPQFTLKHTNPRHHHITPHHTTLHYTTLHHTTPHYTTPHHTTPHHKALYVHYTPAEFTTLNYTRSPHHLTQTLVQWDSDQSEHL